MFTTSLLGFFVVFLGITSAERTPSIVYYVPESNNTRAANTLETGTPSNRSHSAEGVTIVGGSEVNQANETYLTFERIKNTVIILPPAHHSGNGFPKSLAELMTGPEIHPNVMNPDRRLIVQRNLNYSKELSDNFEKKLHELMMINRANISKLSLILQFIMSVKLRLQDQQKMLDDFNIVRLWSPPKIDHFDRDLASINGTIKNLIAESLTAVPLNI